MEMRNVINTLSMELEKYLGPFGFEFYPFKVGWYHSLVQPIFHLDYHEDTLAFLVISSPRMFENGFLPFINQTTDFLCGTKDPIDECMLFYISKIKDMFPHMNVDIIHDFELHPSRRPKMIFQSAAHASGAAYFYHKKDIERNITEHWNSKKIYGVCIHPKYGGWFALRAVAIFKDIQCPELQKVEPLDVVPLQEDRERLLELYNFHWKDWRFRDIVDAEEKYSELQMKYFNLPPGNRLDFVKEIINNLEVS